METTEIINCILNRENIKAGTFANKIGVKPTQIYDLMSGKIKKISGSIANKIKRVYPQYNLSWLLTGEGDVLKDDKIIEENIINSTNDYLLVPVIHVDSVGGMHSPNEMSDGLQYIEHYVPFVNARKGDIAIYESGNSMIPTIPPGSLILIRKVEQWREYIGYGNIYVIELTDGRRLTKEIAKYEPDPKNYVLCKSHNPDVADEELPRSMIVSVWKVLKILINKGW